jgi:putative spermidine/putrescine transport system substrate-binding protein
MKGHHMQISRRGTILIASMVITAGLSACGAPGVADQQSAGKSTGPVPDKPSKPVVLNILDVAGNLQLTQGMIDDFVHKNPDVISRVTYTKATSPDLVGKIKAQQDAGRVDIGLVLTGGDGMAAGTQQGMWLPLLPGFASRLSNMSGYLPSAAKMQTLAGNNGVVVTYTPSGPLLEYLPSRVATPPTTAEQLLDYAKAHPGKVEYARPASSGPGRTFLMGLPYVLGDSDPKDPVNGWTKTWAYLTELDKYISTYPGATTQTMKDLANGTVDIIASTAGWTINPIALKTVPQEATVTTMRGYHLVTDAHYAVIPKGASVDQQSADLLLIQFMLTKEQQAKAYDSGYFYPGPAISGVDLSMAPAESQETLKRFDLSRLDSLIANAPTETSLPPEALVTAFDLWDRRVGGSKVKQ